MQIFYILVQPVAKVSIYHGKENKMVTTSSKNNSYICVQDVCNDRIVSCAECHAKVDRKARIKESLRNLWINIRLFFETDKWDHQVTLRVGDSYYTMKMEDIEARWRNLKP